MRTRGHRPLTTTSSHGSRPPGGARRGACGACHHGRVDAEDFRQIRDAVRQLVRESVVPREEQIEDEDRIPDELRAQAAEMGLFGYALPEEYGGLGVTMSEDVQLAFEFGYTTPAFRSLFGTNNGIAGQVIAKFGTDDAEEEVPAAAGRRRADRLLRAHRGRGRLRPRRRCAPPPAATATSGSSTAASATSPTRRSPTCSSSSPAPTRTSAAAGASPASSSRPRRRGSRSAPRTRRWASPAPGPPRCSSTTSGCPPTR